MQIAQGELTYLFDAAPTMDSLDAGDDRVVAVWGYSRDWGRRPPRTAADKRGSSQPRMRAADRGLFRCACGGAEAWT